MEGVEGMDKKEGRFAWMPSAMPGVAKLIAERRRRLGDAHVTDCIKRGLRGEPGFFFAREGALAVGTPWDGDPVMANFAAASVTSTQALVIMREPELSHGA